MQRQSVNDYNQPLSPLPPIESPTIDGNKHAFLARATTSHTSTDSLVYLQPLPLPYRQRIHNHTRHPVQIAVAHVPQTPDLLIPPRHPYHHRRPQHQVIQRRLRPHRLPTQPHACRAAAHQQSQRRPTLPQHALVAEILRT